MAHKNKFTSAQIQEFNNSIITYCDEYKNIASSMGKPRIPNLNGITYFQASAKENINIKEIFESTIIQAYKVFFSKYKIFRIPF